MQRTFKTMGDLAGHFERVANKIPAAKARMLDKIGNIVSLQAVMKLGKYQTPVGPFAGWAPLAESTKEQRAFLGYPEDEPLLMSGELQNSVSYTVYRGIGEVRIGSPLPYAEFLEWGTRKMPPRPFLGPSMIESRPQNDKAIVKEIADAFRSTR